MSKHTAGPWVAELGADGGFAIEADRKGITGGLLVLASRNTHPLMADQMHANAILIAAAPELLEALVDVMFRHVPFSIKADYAEKARAAIAKATGEQS